MRSTACCAHAAAPGSPRPAPGRAVAIVATEGVDGVFIGPGDLSAAIGYLGDWTTYLVELESGRTIRAARANAARFVDRPVDWDDKVWLTFARDAGVVLTQ